MLFIIIVFLLFVIAYFYSIRTFNYWSDRNVPHNKPIPFFGNNFQNYFKMVSRAQMATEIYKQYPNERFVGHYRGATPELFIYDPDLIKHILTIDFLYFHDRGLGRDPKYEPLLANLFHADGDMWKLLRQRLTPAFTSGKLRNMFPLIVECAEQLQNLAEQKCVDEKPYDVREMMARFTTDFIGACGFGIKMNSINDSSSRFRELGKEIFTFRLSSAVKIILKEQFPYLFRHISLDTKSVFNSIVEILSEVIEQRNHKPTSRNDFVDLLLELKNKGKIITESIENLDEHGKGKIVECEVDLMLMAAQVFIFFAAGFETSSSATSFTLHQLAFNPHVQEKVQKEIDQVLAKYDNKLCYDAVKDMKYLECAFYESLRIFPSLGLINRRCTKKYRIPDTDVWIDKGVIVTIPVSAIQNDEKYFKNAEEFDPDRFLPEASRERHKFVFLPFGDGPRACIGLRLGLMQSIAGLAAILHKFTFEPVPGGKKKLLINPSSNVVQNIIGGVPLLVKKRT